MRRATFLTTDPFRGPYLTYGRPPGTICIASGRCHSRRSGRRTLPMTLVDDYLARTPRSRALFERATALAARRLDPDDRLHARPIRRTSRPGPGLRIRDVDGNEYRDFLGNYTSLILGHAHPAVVAAVEAQVRRGSAFAAPTETEVELAEEIRAPRAVDRAPAVHELRAPRRRCSPSGRRGRSPAGRSSPSSSAPTTAPTTRSWPGRRACRRRCPGSSSSCRGATRTASRPPCAAAKASSRRSSSSRSRAPAASARRSPAFLDFLRELTERVGALLIFDEIISFRVAPGGAQERFGVRPDLTTLGKIIGGGYPLAAFGGRADVMAMFDARRPGAVSHGGTFNGSPVAAAAGLATLRELTPDDVRPARRARRAARARVAASIERDGHRRPGRGRRLAVPGLPRGGRDAPSRPASPAARRCSSACCSRASTSRRAAWARSPRSRPRPTSTTSRRRSAARWRARADARRRRARDADVRSATDRASDRTGPVAPMLEISALTARRYVMGRQGLWPGRRWQGLDGTGAAMRAMEDLQLDPLVVVARAHDLMLHSRVVDYAIDDWATLTYERREFFEWGGWLAVRPMEELPYFRVVMRRERDHGHWLEVEREHADGDRGDARRPARARRGQQPRLRDARSDADRPLPRPQGQRARAPLPVAGRRGDGHPARAVRARLRPDRGGRPGRGAARGRPERGRRRPARASRSPPTA